MQMLKAKSGQGNLVFQLAGVVLMPLCCKTDARRDLRYETWFPGFLSFHSIFYIVGWLPDCLTVASQRFGVPDKLRSVIHESSIYVGRNFEVCDARHTS